jgi:SAM-dependent methyltransferase
MRGNISEAMQGLDNWLKTPPGRYALAWQQARFDAVVADLFGYHALQLGLPAAIDALAANRMPHRWRAALAEAPETTPAIRPASRLALVANPIALPFPEASLDLIVLPHAFGHGHDPRAVLREIGRVLVHEGHMVITGINRASLWCLTGALPSGSNPVNPRRLGALMQGADLVLETVHHGGFGFAPRLSWNGAPPGLLHRWRARLWPASGALWCAVAVKRSRGAILVGPAWKTQPAGASAPAGVARRTKQPLPQ